jgi:ribosome-associated translation inhibitor RaiA
MQLHLLTFCGAGRVQGHAARHAETLAAFKIAARKLEKEIAVLKTRREVPTEPSPEEEKLQVRLG